MGVGQRFTWPTSTPSPPIPEGLTPYAQAVYELVAASRLNTVVEAAMRKLPMSDPEEETPE